MKVLHLSTADHGGGAARAAYRIHKAIGTTAIESSMFVLHRGTNDPTVKAAKPSTSFLASALDRARRRWIGHARRNWQTSNPVFHTFGDASAGLVDRINASDADVLHLHWISGLLSIKDISRLRKPLVWTLHDMWAFCGGEHYSPEGHGARYRDGYLPGNRPRGEAGPDLNRLTWEAKRSAWRDLHFSVVGDSLWMARCARESLLFSSASITAIHYPIDVDGIWSPMSKSVARAALRLPQEPLLILMGADGGIRDPRKGGDLLRLAVHRVASARPGAYELAIFGQEQPSTSGEWACKVHWLGELKDDRLLALAYSAADVMVVPSRQEAFGQTALEAHACGTPAVAFDVGGLPDIITHKEDGWLAPPFDDAELAKGILWLTNEADRVKVAENARRNAVERFHPALIGSQYVDVYEAAVRGSPQ